MQATRERILAYLEGHSASSAGEIGRYLDMTPANIRYHLEILSEQGLVEVSGKRTPFGAGRPILLYSLTALYLGDNIITLLEAFLASLSASANPGKVLERAVHHLRQGMPAESSNRIQRFNEGVEFLNNHHYHASWEARMEGPRVELRHCPYKELPLAQPLLCQMDERLLSAVFGVDLILTERRAFGKNPFSPCIFQTASQQGKKG